MTYPAIIVRAFAFRQCNTRGVHTTPMNTKRYKDGLLVGFSHKVGDLCEVGWVWTAVHSVAGQDDLCVESSRRHNGTAAEGACPLDQFVITVSQGLAPMMS